MACLIYFYHDELWRNAVRLVGRKNSNCELYTNRELYKSHHLRSAQSSSKAMKNIILLKNKTTPTDPYDVRLLEEKWNPIFVPLLRHSHSDKAGTIEYLKSEEFMNASYFIITSQRAVEMFGECLREIDDETVKASIYNKIGYTVGPATYKVLTDIGFLHVRGGRDAGNGSVLADIITKEVDKSQNIVFFTGEIRKDIIPRKLKGNNHKLEEKVIYKTEPRDDLLENFQRISEDIAEDTVVENWVVFFSPQGTESIVKYIRENGLKYKIASIGPTTQEYLQRNSMEPQITSRKPEADSLFESLQSFGSSSN